jgi:hypothetical protein
MATRQMTTYQIAPSTDILKKYSKSESIIIYKNASLAKGIKFLAFNDSTGKFSIDSMYIPKVTDVLISTGIQANFINTSSYEDNKIIPSPSPAPRPIAEIKVNYDPSQYTEYPVKSGEYAYMISQKYANSPTKWTEIIRKNTSAFLNSTSASQLKAGEILLIPKAWNAPSIVPNKENDYPSPPTNDPTKKSDDDLLFFGAMGYGLWKFFL